MLSATMPPLNPQAHTLNETIEKEHPALWSLLSDRGKKLFFPTKGIMAQSADAKDKRWNATIGIALDDDGMPMRLPSIDEHIGGIDPRGIYPYANSYGVQAFREAWQGKIREKNPSLKASISLPVVTGGLTHALNLAVWMVLDEGEELVLLDLYWGNYNLMFENLCGVALKKFNTFDGDGLDLPALKSSLAEGERKKVLLLNFPNNPSGYTPTEVEAKQIVTIIKGRAEAGDTVAVILDDAYFGLVYEDGVERESLVGPLADLHQNVIVVKVDGPTKEDYVWGFRVGCITLAGKGMSDAVHRAFEAKAAGAVRGTVSNVSHPAQSLLLKAYASQTYAREKQEKYETLKARYDTVRKTLRDPKYAEVFKPLPYNSGYFVCVELADGLDAEAVRQKLLADYDTGVISLGNKFRIAYSSLPKDDIPAFFENLYQACTT